MSDRDEHLEALRGMWGELKTLNVKVETGLEEVNARLDQTNARLDQTNARLDQTNARLDRTNTRFEDGYAGLSARFDRLERRQVESEVRLATEIVNVVGAIGEVRDLLRDGRLERQRLDRLEHRVDALENLEKKRP